MMDLSDGLARDAPRMARASGVDFMLEEAALADFAATLRAAADVLGADPRDWVLRGGEDFALLATFPPTSELPEGFTPVGTVMAGTGSVWLKGMRLVDGGWDHFAL